VELRGRPRSPSPGRAWNEADERHAHIELRRSTKLVRPIQRQNQRADRDERRAHRERSAPDINQGEKHLQQATMLLPAAVNCYPTSTLRGSSGGSVRLTSQKLGPNIEPRTNAVHRTRSAQRGRDSSPLPSVERLHQARRVAMCATSASMAGLRVSVLQLWERAPDSHRSLRRAQPPRCEPLFVASHRSREFEARRR